MQVCEKGAIMTASTSRKCALHENCNTVILVWPVEKIESLWASIDNLHDPLLKEATTCHCGKKAHWLCVYGGHMVCDCSVIWKERNLKCKTRSTFECRTCVNQNKHFPLWPNPFAYMYLHPGGKVHESHVDGKITLFDCKNGPQSFIVQSWEYEHDRFPQQITHRTMKIISSAWRVNISPGESLPLYLDTCRCMWMNAVPSMTLQKVMTRAERILQSEEGWTVISHPDIFFIYLEHCEEGILCLGCLTKYKNLTSFSASLCGFFCQPK